jgi:hypothetical protein
VPFVILALPRWRMKVPVAAPASVLTLAGVFVHCLTIVMNGRSEATVGFPPGVPLGTAQPPGIDSFALSVLFGALIFAEATLALPLREEAR